MFISCEKDQENKGIDLTHIEYDAQPYSLDIPDYFPDLDGGVENPFCNAT